MSRRFAPLQSEDGAALLIVALWLPVLIVFSSFAIDVGNWFVHQRHLQTQVDAGALAGGGLYNACLQDVLGGGGTGGAAIITKAQQYDGDPTYDGTDGPQYNPQIGGGYNRTKVNYNSLSYPNGEVTNDGTVPGSPCTAKMLDLKASELNIPLFFAGGFIPFANLPAVNAHARVEIKPLVGGSHVLPIGVPDPNPTSGVVTFVNDVTGAALSGCKDSFGNALFDCTVPISKDAVANGLTWWDNVAAQVSVPIGIPRIGVRVAFAGGTTALCATASAGSPACGAGVSAASGSTTCAQVLVTCYESGTATSLADIRGYSTSPSGAQQNPPQLRSVQLVQGTNCADPYFSSDKLSCPNVQIQAHIDFGSLSPSSATVNAFGATCGVKGCPLTYKSGDLWQSGDIAVSTAGARPFALQWTESAGSVTIGSTTTACGTGGQVQPCGPYTFQPGGGTTDCGSTTAAACIVQQTYIASADLTDSIKAVQVWNYDTPAAPLQWANSFQSGTTHSLVVKVGLIGSLADAQSVSDPIVSLRVLGSQNQAIYCDPAVPPGQLVQMIEYGCSPSYTQNTGTNCPNTATALFNTPQPYQCVPVELGGKTNMIAQGLIPRIYGSNPPATCPALGSAGANNWSLFPDLPNGDPRIVEVFLTPFGTFSGSGEETVPVEQFATFYITGWTTNGNANQDPCASEEDPAPSSKGGYIVGHFIKYIQTLNNGGAGPGSCDFNSFGACIVVLTQ